MKIFHNIKKTKKSFSQLQFQEYSSDEQENIDIKSIDEINFSNATLEYENKIILSNWNYTFKKGNKYLIKGISGSGKSSILELIIKNKILSNGNIILNGDTDIKNVSIDNLNQEILYWNHENIIIDGDLKYNIFLDENKKEDIDIILKEVNLNDKNQSEYSEGEMQRISLLRILSNKKKWIILDEAFSNLDSNNRRIIEEKFLSIPNISLIVISHNNILEIEDKYDVILEKRIDKNPVVRRG